MSSSSGKDISGLCRICGSTTDTIGSIPKSDLVEPILNCLQIDVRKDKVIICLQIGAARPNKISLCSVHIYRPCVHKNERIEPLRYCAIVAFLLDDTIIRLLTL